MSIQQIFPPWLMYASNKVSFNLNPRWSNGHDFRLSSHMRTSAGDLGSTPSRGDLFLLYDQPIQPYFVFRTFSPSYSYGPTFFFTRLTTWTEWLLL